MSQLRFTPITSNLLARKGDAVPSAIAPKPSLFWTQGEVPPSVTAEQPRADAQPATKPHRMVVTLSAVEFEKLGIAAVKKGVTRHQIVRTALDLHLERLRREFNECGCISAEGPCPKDCAAG